MFELMETAGQQAVIKVLGIGGGGGNAGVSSSNEAGGSGIVVVRYAI